MFLKIYMTDDFLKDSSELDDRIDTGKTFHNRAPALKREFL